MVDAFPDWHRAHLLQGQMRKLGLAAPANVDRLVGDAEFAADADAPGDAPNAPTAPGVPGTADVPDSADAALADDWLALMAGHRIDFTLGWRRLADAAEGDVAPLRALFADDPQSPDAWLARWQARYTETAPDVAGAQRAGWMRSVNPLVIPRNHRVEEALAAASAGIDLEPFERLLEAVTHPFEEPVDGQASRYAESAPPEVTARYQTFCGT